MSSSPYSPAARLLEEIWATKKSLKTLAYDKKGQLKCNKATYAQVCHVLESKTLIDKTVEKAGKATLQLKKNARNPALLYVLLYELLLGPNKKIRGGGALKRQIVSHKDALQNALELVQVTHKTSESSIPLFPRYVRVNTLKTSITEVAESLSKSFEKTQIYVDEHVPNVLVLPPTTSLGGHDLVRSGKVVLQDKSSCFSALCLMYGGATPLLDGDCLDACAAPGNKTSHLASLLATESNKTKRGKKQKRRAIYALDRSSDRLKILQRRMNECIPADHSLVEVIPQHKDFLQTTPGESQYKSLKGILLDPSCSGSGIFTSPDRSTDEAADKSRIVPLSNFQLVSLKHAMTFPQVERIVYSTCSLHEEENENVVAQAIEASPEWEVVAPVCLNGWKRRGHVVKGLTEEQAKCLIRADRGDDTNGFFVCYLERKTKLSADTNIEPSDVRILPKGMSFYSGEFASEDTPTNSKKDSVSKTLSAQKKDKPQQTAVPKEAPKKGVSKTSSKQKKDKPQQTALQKEQPSAPTDGKSKDKKVCKKKGKKLAWKKRQMEQKLERMKKKAESQKTETKD